MTEKKRRILTILSSLALFLSIALIFTLTFQSYNDTLALSNKVRVMVYGDEPENVSVLEQTGIIRKMAHIPEYWILGASAAFFFHFHWPERI